MSSRARVFAVAACLVGALAADARAQDALGSGDALDANPSATQGRRNRPAPVQDFRSRNRLVTRDVAGGREFRGLVGYADEGDFRGRLGSNDLFNFRAGSAFSSPQLIGTGGTYEQLRFGLRMGEIGYRRAGSAASPQRLYANQYRVGDPGGRVTIDRMTLASSLAMRQAREAEPSVVGAAVTETGEALFVSASPVLGVFAAPREREAGAARLSSFDLARLREDEREGRGIELGGRFEARVADVIAEPGRVETVADDTRIDLQTAPDYARILQRIADRYATAGNVDLKIEPGLVDELDTELEELRQRLRGEDETPAPEGAETPPDGTPGATPDERRPPEPPKTVADFGIILKHGERVDRLASDDEGRFNELLASAEERLRDGEYFWAERRFERALGFVPGHPLATAGLGHARIGAGLHLRAALTLRELFQNQPEMIDVRYADELLPNRVQVNIALEELEKRLAMEADPTDSDRPLYGFLLAYIGHQIDDADLVARGLGVMAASAPDDPLLELLRPVWGGDAAAGDDPGK
ncbi:MAG: hypothetical protein ACYTG1_02745 [Planctomycetota bacterium]|jgi:hypothetical protein